MYAAKSNTRNMIKSILIYGEREKLMTQILGENGGWFVFSCGDHALLYRHVLLPASYQGYVVLHCCPGNTMGGQLPGVWTHSKGTEVPQGGSQLVRYESWSKISLQMKFQTTHLVSDSPPSHPPHGSTLSTSPVVVLNALGYIGFKIISSCGGKEVIVTTTHSSISLETLLK